LIRWLIKATAWLGEALKSPIAPNALAASSPASSPQLGEFQSGTAGRFNVLTSQINAVVSQAAEPNRLAVGGVGHGGQWGAMSMERGKFNAG
jgi:hypothetical protein